MATSARLYWLASFAILIILVIMNKVTAEEKPVADSTLKGWLAKSFRPNTVIATKTRLNELGQLHSNFLPTITSTLPHIDGGVVLVSHTQPSGGLFAATLKVSLEEFKQSKSSFNVDVNGEVTVTISEISIKEYDTVPRSFSTYIPPNVIVKKERTTISGVGTQGLMTLDDFTYLLRKALDEYITTKVVPK